MQYLLIICDDPTVLAGMSGADHTRRYEAYRAFTDEIRTAGLYVDGNPLEPVATATTIRLRGGKRLVTDGPFAESKEHLVGYYLIDVPDLDAALTVAARIPSATTGAVEVRPNRSLHPA